MMLMSEALRMVGKQSTAPFELTLRLRQNQRKNPSSDADRGARVRRFGTPSVLDRQCHTVHESGRHDDNDHQADVEVNVP